MTEQIMIILGGLTLFLGGFYSGIWVQRNSREVIEREVPKIITTEKVAFAEVPHVVQVPTPAQPKQPTGGPVAIGQQPTNVLSPERAAEARRMTEVMNSAHGAEM